MREIKFRIWEKRIRGRRTQELNRYYYFDSKTSDGHRYDYDISPMTGAVICSIENDDIYSEIEGEPVGACWNASSDVVLQQYTGLKDKNGVEIYEGDIVKELVGKKTYLGDKRIKRSGIGAIAYGVYYAVSDDPYCSAEVEGFHIDGEIFSSNLRDYSESELEVIGNIYEHGHLLENESKE